MESPINASPVIVIGVELDETGDTALREAALLAAQSPGARLHPVHVIREVKEAIASESDGKGASLSDTRLAELARRARLAFSGPAESLVDRTQLHLGIGDVEKELLQIAADVQADIIIVGAHTRTGLKSLVSGDSLAVALARSAPCPVLIARPKDYEGLPKTLAIDAFRPGEDTLSSRPHTYSYRRELPLRTQDANVIPTGIDPELVF